MTQQTQAKPYRGEVTIEWNGTAHIVPITNALVRDAEQISGLSVGFMIDGPMMFQTSVVLAFLEAGLHSVGVKVTGAELDAAFTPLEIMEYGNVLYRAMRPDLVAKAGAEKNAATPEAPTGG